MIGFGKSNGGKNYTGLASHLRGYDRSGHDAASYGRQSFDNNGQISAFKAGIIDGKRSFAKAH
jgi:hypothetical protein